MLPLDSPAASSPFSSRSTVESSPEVIGGDSSKNGHTGYAAIPTGVMQVLLGVHGGSQQYTAQQDVKPFHSIPAPMVRPSKVSERMAAVKTTATATSTSHGGSRAEPPKRMYEVEGLQVVSPSIEELVDSSNGRNRLLLQGDPLYSDKSRVETAIRLIIDFLWLAPFHPPKPPPSIHPLIPRDANDNLLMTFERISTFHGLKFQAGTTTKNSSKKQLQAIGHIPKDKLAYLETAVYMSGENGKRIYVCKRCRNREARRRDAKNRNRKRAQPTSDSDASSSVLKPPRQSLVTPSPDFITAENPDNYDPKKVGQVVEEPPWDPDYSDWRHEIVLFNTPSEIRLEDGSCNWLPFRVVCYGKCHGEKIGFRIKFTLRAHDGRIIASSITKPIRITDDHKTDTKSRSKTVSNITSLNGPVQPPVPRRKARASATSVVSSSRAHSPTPSESESVQSFQSLSEAGAVLQKQTPNVRAGKPYERPTPHVQTPSGPSAAPSPDVIQQPLQVPSPMSYVTNQMAGLPFSVVPNESASTHTQSQQVQTHQSSMHLNDINMSQLVNTVSPQDLRGPQFNGTNPNVPHSSGGSVASSTGGSPRSQMLGLAREELANNGGVFSQSFLTSLNQLNNQDISHGTMQGQGPMLYNRGETEDGMVNLISNGFDDLLNRSASISSRASISSVDNDQGSMFSGWDGRSSAIFSQSGLPPDSTVVEESDEMEKYLDYTGECQQQLSQGQGLASPSISTGFPGLLDTLRLNQNSQAQSVQPQASISSSSARTQPQPSITHVIPGEGPMAGGSTIAIAGQHFSPGMVIVFGQRPAATEFVNGGFMQCRLPPSAFAGVVEVTIQGFGSGVVPGAGTKMLFTYTDMEKDAMKLALAIQSHYQDSSTDAAYRLTNHIPRTTNNTSQWSGSNPGVSLGNNNSVAINSAALVLGDSTDEDSNSQPSSSDTQSIDSEASDLQSTIITFLASLDSHAPGSLRASGAINLTNSSQQTFLHIASAMGFSRLVRRLIVGGAQIDVQDVNGFTPLAFAALCGRLTCARVLIEAGASYDRATAYGEMPLDLAKFGEHAKVEKLLLSAVWSTNSESIGSVPAFPTDGLLTTGYTAEMRRASPKSVIASPTSSIDNDNPSSGSEAEQDISKLRLSSAYNRRRSRIKDKRTMSVKSERFSALTPGPSALSSNLKISVEADRPPPYTPPAEHIDIHQEHMGWIKTISNLSHLPQHHFIPNAVWDHLPSRSSLFSSNKSIVSPLKRRENQIERGHSWAGFTSPSWHTLSKMTNPEEMKLFTQAMAAAALNAVVQTGMATPVTASGSHMFEQEWERGKESEKEFSGGDKQDEEKKSRGRRKRSATASGSGSGVALMTRKRESTSPGDKVVQHVKRDRMLYLFWLPILLFVGFWLLVSALPIATGFSLIYARKITRAIKQRM
nr:suppressor protein SPT23 [Cryptococcus depauperatus CBS 7841]